MTSQFGLPPLRGENFLTMGRTGQLFVPKIHDSRRISLLIEVADLPAGHAQTAFDALSVLFSNRGQGALVNNLPGTATVTTPNGLSTVLTANAAAGATSIVLLAATNIADNKYLRIGDSEVVQVDPAWSAGTTIPLVVALRMPHAAGEAVVMVNDTGARTGQAECVSWQPSDPDRHGLMWTGVVDFLLADPWLYGPTVSGTVTPNAGLAFGTPVINQIGLVARTTWAAALTGVVSGQPIIVVHITQGYTTALTSIADTFAGHYTYTRVDGNNTGTQDLEIYIGTGGTGTSGTVTVTAASGLIGGAAIPMTGASTSAGLGAVDVHGNTSGSGAGNLGLSLTPTAAWEGAIFAALTADPYIAGYNPPFPSPYAPIFYGVRPVGEVGCYLYPTNGVAFTPQLGLSGGVWEGAAAIIKGSGAAVTLNITNTGTALAEKLTLDFLGPIVNPTITNTTNGTSVTINTTVAGTKHLLVDTGAFTALNNGANVIGLVTHTGAAPFLTLNPGANALQVSGAACDANTRVTVSFLPPFV